MNKYHARKYVFDGKTFDSQAEAARYAELRLLERSGHIKDLQTQVVFVLIPTQKKHGRTERAVKYVADFVYYDRDKGERVVEDCKGFRTPEYIIKRKLMLKVFDVAIREVNAR